MAFDFDLFVIGAGSGGVRAARIASSHGARVAVAEEYRVGGTCVIRGCVPKKLLVYGSHFAEDLADAQRFGWNTQGATFDWRTLRDNVAAEVDRLEGLYGQTLGNAKVEIYRQRAIIAGPNSVRLADGSEISAANILIATGAWPSMPDIAGAEYGITSNEVFHLDKLPKRAVIAGAGYIANEFAGIFNELGVEVTLVTRGDKMLRSYDQEIVEKLVGITREKGIDICFNFKFPALRKQADGSLLVESGTGEDIETDLVLFAIGRVPKTKDLGLEAAGVAMDEEGAVIVDEHNRTNVPGIYAVGDVTNRVQLTPVAIREGHAFADTVFGSNPRTIDYGSIPTAVFSNPPIAGVGLTEEEARSKLADVKVYKSDFRAMKNVLAGRNERALYKMIVDGATDRVVGLHLIGPDSAEILQAAAIAVKAGLTKQAFDDTVALHPSMAEELVLLK
ncbi:MAG: glutathione-disulfide reductase [Sphingomonadales bacterium]|jgi:glutathione reductase (NADPH)|nr:glutathione-disulfide reductase [Sphingomonadales bacterium]MBK9003611.1 glutathione-disulfide reductase [Sphingomonadales bacterium]MBK9268784.1 glutathione-disulfide reductase [Sphingomonadales bacterium]MBP6433606.1 glutathione-disulfide reductase [Sphingorhabdus sp.]